MDPKTPSNTPLLITIPRSRPSVKLMKQMDTKPATVVKELPTIADAVVTIACAMAFAGIWIEKGMGLIVPGFIPTPIGEVTEYHPTLLEWVMTAGIWAFGFFILTILLKGAIGILNGDIKLAKSQAGASTSVSGSAETPANP